jgi:hypothetical protein
VSGNIRDQKISNFDKAYEINDVVKNTYFQYCCDKSELKLSIYNIPVLCGLNELKVDIWYDDFVTTIEDFVKKYKATQSYCDPISI